MLRIVALALLPLVPGLTWALGLGDITVTSALNEPLRASIQVHSLRPGEAEELLVRVADEEAFRRVGLERSSVILGMDIQVVPGPEETEAAITLATRQGIREPILSFLLDISGVRNRMLREYTVLLDPVRPKSDQATPDVPVVDVAEFSSPARQPLPAPPPTASEPVRPASEPVRPASERLVPVPAPERLSGNQPILEAEPVAKPRPGQVTYEDVPVDGERYGPVAPGTTPWRVALAIRPDNKVTMDQVLWALYSANPDAFDGNLNLLIEGAILTVPSRQAMINVSPAEAAALVAEDTAAHHSEATAQRDRTSPAPAVRAPETVRAEPAPTPRPTPKPTPAATPRPTAVPTAKPRAQAPLPALPAEPALPALPEEPELEPLPPEEEVSVVAPEDDLGTLREEAGESESPVDEELEALRRLQELAGELDDDALPADQAGDTASASSETEGGEFGNLPSLPEQADTGPVASPESEEEGGFSPMLILLPLLLIGGGIGAFLFLRRRQQTDQAAGGAVLDDGDTDATTVAAVAARDEPAFDQTGEAPTQIGRQPERAHPSAPPVSEPEPQNDFIETDVDETSAFGETSRYQVDSAQSYDETQAFEATVETEAQDESQTVADTGEETLDLGSETVSLELNEDPVSEADFHLAYGLYDEAALLLNQAIESDPERLELREKLVETYFAAGNADAFQEVAQALKERNPGDAVWQKVAIMGQQLCPDAELFQGDVGGDAVDFGFGDDGGGLDMDFESDSDDTPAGPATDAGDDDNLLEFDMGDDAPAAVPETSESPAREDSNLLEFDIDDEAPVAESADEAPGSDDEFSLEDTGFGDLDLDEVEGDDGDLPDIDAELDLGDLEAELDADDDSLTEELSLEEPVPEPAAPEAPESDIEPTEAIEYGEDTSEMSLDLSESIPEEEMSLDLSESIPEEEMSLDLTEKLPKEETPDDNFQVGEGDDDPLADLDVDDLELEALDTGSGDSGEEDTLGADTTLGDEDLNELTAELPEEGLDALDLGDDAGAISDGDEAGTKLDLARAYVDMGEGDMARSLLEEVVSSGSDEQKSEAQELLARLT